MAGMPLTAVILLGSSPATENPELAVLAVALVIVGLVLLFGFLVALLYVSRRRSSGGSRGDRLAEDAMLDAWGEAGRRVEPFPLPQQDERAE